MSWEIKFPHRYPSDPLDLGAVADCAREALDPTEAAVVRSIAVELLLEPGIRTNQDALDFLDGLSADQRRALLDRAREDAGLERTGVVDYERFQASRTLVEPRDAAGNLLGAICAEPSCRRQPVDEVTGGPARVNVKKWWCAEHLHLAAEGDMEAWRSRLAYSPSGSIIDLDEQERERERAEREAEHRRQRREAEQAERRREAAEHDHRDRANLERLRRETPAGFWRP